jgi:aminodeoxyfutalosine deaminase
MDGRCIENGAVLVREGKVVAAGRWETIAGYAAKDVQDAGDCVLLPGLINAHTHLELSDCTPGERPADGLEGWLTRMLTRTRIDAAELERKSATACKIGANQCLRFGVTTVGDISRQCHVTRPVLKDGPLRVVSFGEVMAMAQRRGLLEERLARAADEACASEFLRIAVSPHSPYSIEMQGYARCLEVAKHRGMPLATHLAETLSESEFLEHHSGPLKALWDSWLSWDQQVPRFAGGPIRMAHELGLLDYPTLLAHVNYCDDDELALLARGRASVVYCPRTHEYFGHPPHRFRDMLAAGINVAVGTDSCASSPDLNLVEDLRLMHRVHPQLDAQTLWRMGTANGAKALMIDQTAGTLAPGMRADCVAFPAAGNDPLQAVLESQVGPRGVWAAGQKLA